MEKCNCDKILESITNIIISNGFYNGKGIEKTLKKVNKIIVENKKYVCQKVCKRYPLILGLHICYDSCQKALEEYQKMPKNNNREILIKDAKNKFYDEMTLVLGIFK